MIHSPAGGWLIRPPAILQKENAMWKRESVPATENSVIYSGSCRLAVSPATSGDPGKKWQHFQISFGRFTNDDRPEVTWPREAIGLAREELDALEAKLAEMEAAE